MKLMDNAHGYMTPVMMLFLIIPLLILVSFSAEQNIQHTDNNVAGIDQNNIRTTTDNFEDEIINQAKQTISQVTQNVTETGNPLQNSQKTIQKILQEKIDLKAQLYEKTYNLRMNTSITGVEQSSDPFKIDITYTLINTKNNQTIRKTDTVRADLTDPDYPVYDPQPKLKANTKTVDNTTIKYENNPHLPGVYDGAVSGYILQRCPFDDYKTHADNNKTMLNCLDNHYYHVSHDGLCLLCRLENKTTCPHTGVETFIIPVIQQDRSVVSVDHVLFNRSMGQYEGNIHIFNNEKILYLDNAHRQKYGL